MKPFHEMTRAELVSHLRSLYYAQPKADWDTLAVGNVILHKGRGWRITRIPPKRAFVMATNIATDETQKLLRSQYNDSDLLVTDEATLAILRTVHQDEIRKAMTAIRLSRHLHAVPFGLGREAAGKGPRYLAADQRIAGLPRPSRTARLATTQG
jgi:hypothetical protein